MKKASGRIALLAVLVALALAISVAESWLPLAFIPVPGVKLGLANIITLFALYFLNFRDSLVVLVVRCTLASLFGSGITALAFSLTGGVFALVTMFFMLKSKRFSLAGVSIAGAAMHGVGQIVAAFFMLSSPSVVFYLPFLLIAAIFTGAITGAISHLLFKRIEQIPKITNILV